ncbi:hypothetical protein AC579_9322 [Pseudocercospora musae]|uniref:Major facilitator superfamily (MFS) profile domain-containing protein n=1 Tax=Pseudocercospora musae TaxID=113226 RepID=A0A139I4R5_9PEZI|nr:hypothetical protein AC579_9322 [Pseudocercospora musae]
MQAGLSDDRLSRSSSAKKHDAIHEEMVTRHGILIAEDAEFLASFSTEDHKAVLRKAISKEAVPLNIKQWRLVPMLLVLYLIAFIDRANIGNAKIEGLEDSLNLSGTQFNIALAVFFVPYTLVEIPSNMMLNLFKRPSVFMGSIVTAWELRWPLRDKSSARGLRGSALNNHTTAHQLILNRAGFFPGAILIISKWYLPHETQTRIAIFFTASALAGAFSGLLAFAIAKMDGTAGFESWRWVINMPASIFILEGLASVLLGLSCFHLLIDSPALSSNWLNPQEIRYLELRQLARQTHISNPHDERKSFDKRIFWSVVTDFKIYLLIIAFWSNVTPNYVAVVVAYAILAASTASNNIALCYFAICLACFGLYPIGSGVQAWNLSNLAGPTKRAIGIGYLTCFGNMGGITGSFIFIEDEAPRYRTGFGSSLGFAGAGILACLVLEGCLWWINRRDEREDDTRWTEEELEAMGDKSPRFRYML